jgi:hypothetical protein
MGELTLANRGPGVGNMNFFIGQRTKVRTIFLGELLKPEANEPGYAICNSSALNNAVNLL